MVSLALAETSRCLNLADPDNAQRTEGPFSTKPMRTAEAGELLRHPTVSQPAMSSQIEAPDAERRGLRH